MALNSSTILPLMPPVITSAADAKTPSSIKLGNYLLHKTLLGRGCSSDVMLAEHCGEQKYYAVKVMQKKWIKEHSMQVPVWKEVNIQSSLKHQNVVELKEVMSSEGHLFLVLERVQGQELLGLIRRGQLTSEAHAANVFRQVMEGLAYIHSMGVAHRDIKPENLILSHDGVVKIADFGLSTTVRDQGGSHRRNRSMCGTPHYAAPEIFDRLRKGEGYDACKADVWSAGIVLYAMLTRTLPFLASSAEEAIELVATKPVCIPSYLSHSCQQLLVQMLDKDPDRRPTAQQVLNSSWVQFAVGMVAEDEHIVHADFCCSFPRLVVA
jgi:5'-AMP-activated protein kinase catalytic alpha subunit